MLTSYITNKKLTYLQVNDPLKEFITITTNKYIIQHYSNLFSTVVTPSPKWSEIFNTMPTTANIIRINELNADMLRYTVDDNGTIELTYTCRFMMAEKTLYMGKAKLSNTLKSYIPYSVVSVKLVNNNVKIIAEIQRPGRYQIYKDRIIVFQAITRADDLGTCFNE